MGKSAKAWFSEPGTELMTPNEVAGFLRKSRSWVYAACSRGEVPHVRIGRDLRFRRSELERWLETKASRPAVLKEEL